jgi:hypothetical protein
MCLFRASRYPEMAAQTSGEHQSFAKRVVKSYHLPLFVQGSGSYSLHARAFGDLAGKQDRGLPQGGLKIERI